MTNERMARITVIVPVYNTFEYLDACLESLVQQTFDDIDILCVDDGSTDGSSQALDAWCERDRRIRVIHKRNGGVSSARNAGLDNAVGEYVLFVDSDDYIEANTCEKLIAIADRDRSDIVVFGGETFPSVAWIDHCFDTHDIVYRQDGFRALFQETGSFPLMCNKLYRRSLIEEHKLRFERSLRLGEDNAFQFCTFPHAKVVSFCRGMFYHYRCEREGSAISVFYDDRLSKVKKHFEVVEYVCSQWSEQGFIRGQQGPLLTWAAHFLADDVKLLAWRDRKDLASRFESIVQEYGLAQAECSLDEETAAVVSFMRGRATRSSFEPKASLVLFAMGEEGSLSEGYISLANQSLQEVELICVEDGAGAFGDDSLRSLVSQDARCLFVGSASEALERCRAPYVLFARLGDSYRWDALHTMLKGAEAVGGEVDLVTARDSFSALRTQDLTRRLETFEDGRSWFSPNELPERLFSFSSLDFSNKLWKADYARKSGLDPLDASSIAKALVGARTIVPLSEFVMRIGRSHMATFDEGRAQASRFRDSMICLRDALDGEGLLERYRQAWDNVVLSSGMGMYDLCRSVEVSKGFLSAYAELLRESKVLDDHGRGWFFEAEDYRRATTLLEQGPDLFYESDRYDRLEGLESYVSHLESIVAARDGEISEFYGSISYRAGRAVTALPRKAVDLVRKMRG